MKKASCLDTVRVDITMGDEAGEEGDVEGNRRERSVDDAGGDKGERRKAAAEDEGGRTLADAIVVGVGGGGG